MRVVASEEEVETISIVDGIEKTSCVVVRTGGGLVASVEV